MDELLIRISMANASKANGSTYLVSPAKYKEIKEALIHYEKTGEIILHQDGTIERSES